MSPTPLSHHGELQYAIRVQGRLGSNWSAWFDDLEVSSTEDGTSTIHGRILDQAALHGVLQKLRDLGLPNVSVLQVSTDRSDPPCDPSPPTSCKGH